MVFLMSIDLGTFCLLFLFYAIFSELFMGLCLIALFSNDFFLCLSVLFPLLHVAFGDDICTLRYVFYIFVASG